MNFQELLKFAGPRSFKDGTIYWEFMLYGIKKPELVRAGDIGYYTHDDISCNTMFRFNDFDKSKEAYIVAHEENIRRLKENEIPFEIGKMRSDEWETQPRDRCG